MKWFRDHAAHDQAHEEKEILESEFDRALCYFIKMVDTWETLAKQDALLGYHAYVYRQASMYRAFSSQCQDSYLKAHTLCQRYHDENPVSTLAI